MQTWDLWIPDVGSQGLSFARGIMDPTDHVLVHAAPQSLRVEVRDDSDRLVAFGDGLQRSGVSPMTRLRLSADRVLREDDWPTSRDVGVNVILPGGEVGILKSWWSSSDHSEWRWTVEFYNHR
jgi:hypothetical protein